MAEGKEAVRGAAGTLGKAAGKARQAPGADRLKEELESYIEARIQLMVEDVGHRLGEGARRLAEARLSPRGLGTAVARGGKKLVPSGALTSTASHAKDTAVHAKDVVLDKAKDVTRHGVKGRTGAAPEQAPDVAGRGLTIIEDIDVGVPVREAYDQWTQFQEFERFAKGVVGVEQEDDTTTKWHVKVAKASRRWRGTITEQVPDERIAWTSEGEKATTKGVVTFHPLGENLTKVLLVLRYFPKGPVERMGSLVRAQGRRARLDLKLYRSFVMLRGEATGGWRGEIREGEVVRTPEEVEQAEEGGEARAEGRDEQDEEESYDEEGEEEPADRYVEGDELDEEDEEEEDEEEEDEDDEQDEDYASDEEDDWEENEPDEEEDEEDEGRDPDDIHDARPSTP